MRKKEKKRKKNFKKKEKKTLKKKKSQIKSPCDSVYLFTNSNKSNCSLWRGLGAPPLQAMEPQQEGGGHGGRGSRAGWPHWSQHWGRGCVYILYFYALLCTVESGYCLTGAPYLLEPSELGGHTWRASSLFKHEIGGWGVGEREAGGR